MIRRIVLRNLEVPIDRLPIRHTPRASKRYVYESLLTVFGMDGLTSGTGAVELLTIGGILNRWSR